MYPFQHHSSPLLLIICNDAPESTTNSRSSGLRVGAGKHLFSEGEKNVALSPLILEHFWPASTLLRGHFALGILSLPETDPQILERWGCADEVNVGKFIRPKDFGLEILVWRAIACVNFTRWIGFCMSELFRKIDDRLHVLKDATQFSCIR